MLRLYGEKYPDFNVRHFHEKLQEAHGIALSSTRVKRALQGRGWRVRRADVQRITVDLVPGREGQVGDIRWLHPTQDQRRTGP